MLFAGTGVAPAAMGGEEGALFFCRSKKCANKQIGKS